MPVDQASVLFTDANGEVWKIALSPLLPSAFTYEHCMTENKATLDKLSLSQPDLVELASHDTNELLAPP